MCNLTLSMLRKCICFTVCLTQTLLPVFTRHRCIFHPVICFNSHLQKRYYFPFQSEFAFNTFNMFKERYHFKNFPTDMKANGMKLNSNDLLFEIRESHINKCSYIKKIHNIQYLNVLTSHLFAKIVTVIHSHYLRK